MYCIICYGFSKQYLAVQNTNREDLLYGYYLTDKETFIMNLPNNDKNHPTLFRTEKAADDFIKKLLNKYYPQFRNLKAEWIDPYLIPKCDMDCLKCNKKNKFNCRHLSNPYQNYCGWLMAKFEDGFKPDEKRLDAPCEKCLTKGCIFNMHY